MSSGYVVDKSAVARWDEPAVAAVLDPALAAGALWSCPPVDLEVLYSCQTPQEYAAVRRQRSDSYHHAPLDPAIGVLALELQEALARAGQLRSVGPMDLLIAATAVTNNLTVLHYDRDFEILAEIAPQVAQRWVVPRGSVA